MLMRIILAPSSQMRAVNGSFLPHNETSACADGAEKPAWQPVRAREAPLNGVLMPLIASVHL
jgi:hypothetical protein